MFIDTLVKLLMTWSRRFITAPMVARVCVDLVHGLIQQVQHGGGTVTGVDAHASVWDRQICPRHQ